MKKEILKQLYAEAKSKQMNKQAEYDAEYFTALADSKGKEKIKRKVPEAIDNNKIQKELINRLKQKSGLSERAPKNFSTEIFKNQEVKNNYKKTYDFLERYVNNFPPTTKPNLILCGQPGTGKTHTAQIIGTKILDRGFSVLCVTAFSLIQRFKNYIFNFENNALDDLFTCDLLIIDDLGTEPKIKNISDEYLLNVINERISRNAPFLITTNLSPDDILARYDQRLTSRLLSKQSSIVIEMKSEDLRLQN